MQLISAFLSDETSVSLVTEAVIPSDPEADVFPYHLMVNGRIDCSYNTWEHAWEDFTAYVRSGAVLMQHT